MDLSDVEQLKLPDYTNYINKRLHFLEIDYVDDKAFVDLPRLKSLHLTLTKPLEINLSLLINLKKTLHLKP